MNWESLSSDAADGSVLANLIISGRAGRNFARAHAQELQSDADQIRMNVADEQAPGHQRLEAVAEQLSSALGDIVIHPADPSVARHTEATLKQLSEKMPKAFS